MIIKQIEENMDFETGIYGDGEGLKIDILRENEVVESNTEVGKISCVHVEHLEGNHNAMILNGGNWEVTDIKAVLSGERGNDFKGLGAGILVTADTDVIFENLNIICKGASRSAIVIKNQAKVLIQNSYLSTIDGDMAPDYVGTVFPEKMKSVPWMLGVNGSARTTNLMDRAIATYVNSTIEALKWGALSTDDNKGVCLWAINCDVLVSGGMKSIEEIKESIANGKYDFYKEELDKKYRFPEGEWQPTMKPSGYGTYSIGDTQVVLAGSMMIVPDYIAIIANGSAGLHITSSEPIGIAEAHAYLHFVNVIKPKKSLMISNRFGLMYHSGVGFGVTRIDRGSVLCTRKTALVIKGCGTIINIDASHIYTGNGIILQVMDNDDAGINIDTLETTCAYEEEHIRASASETHTNAGILPRQGAVYATFSNMSLDGDIYNASGWEVQREADVLGMYNNEVGGGASRATDLALCLDHVSYTGIISTTEAYHMQHRITHKEYDMISEVTNTVCIPENAGICIELKNHSVWYPTGVGYITSLFVDNTSKIYFDEMYVNGERTKLHKGIRYTGVIKIIGSYIYKPPVFTDISHIISGRG